jgi:hypothetical protein
MRGNQPCVLRFALRAIDRAAIVAQPLRPDPFGRAIVNDA